MADILTVDALKAYYLMNYFGVQREVRAVDDITMTVGHNEVYGIAGESSSGKTSFIKVLAAAIRPPLRVVAGSATYRFGDINIDVTKAGPDEIEAIRWKHLSYIMQGSMSVLNPVRRIERHLRGFRGAPARAVGPGLPRAWSRTSASSSSGRRCCAPIRTSCRAACASA